MGILDKLFKRRDIHIHVHVDGAIRVDKDELHKAIEGISKLEKSKLRNRFTPGESPQLEPTLGGEVLIPVVEFGEQVNDE